MILRYPRTPSDPVTSPVFKVLADSRNLFLNVTWSDDCPVTLSNGAGFALHDPDGKESRFGSSSGNSVRIETCHRTPTAATQVYQNQQASLEIMEGRWSINPYGRCTCSVKIVITVEQRVL